jgi:Domain of unknown function (DUF4259)
MRTIHVALLVLAIALPAWCGTWGSGSFENDYAMDWVATLVLESDTAFVYSTLEKAKKQTYVHEPKVCSAVAAAEVVAAMLGHPSSDLPPNLTQWIKTHTQRPTPAQVALAREVLGRVLDAEHSELAAFWPDSDPEGWRAMVRGVIGRLPNHE